jgi:NADPH-dependent 2,4-dienoyl-CoA reductase/sulfur reductase-like enzyme
MKHLVIGGNAAGMSAASRIRRKAPESDVVVLEKTFEVSYGACGLPYYVAGLNDDLNLVRIRPVSAFEKAGVHVRLGHTAERVDFAAKTVCGRTLQGDEFCEPYDRLLIATGASPRRPNVPGADRKNIFTLKTPADAQALRAALEQNPANVVIVGGGAIGLELAEACLLQKVKRLCVIEALGRLLPPFDAEFAEEAKHELERHGVQVQLGERVMELAGDEAVERVVTDKGVYDADVVILSIGGQPNTAFLTGIEKLPNGAILTDRQMRTSAADVFAAGDCASVWHAVLDAPAYLALGTNANKQGRLAGDGMAGFDACFDRALGTVMVRCMGLELAKTGIGEREAAQTGIPAKTKTVKTLSHPPYYPGACELTIKLCYHADGHVLLGAQIMGEREAAWRIDPLAVAVDRKMTTEELGYTDLGYAPPFASAWDAIHIAANAAK